MRVGYITPEDLPVPPVRGGSVQIYTHTLLQQFSQMRHFGIETPDIVLISPDKTRESGWRQTCDGDVLHYTIRSKDKQDYRQQVIRLLSEINPDVIQVDNRPKFARFIQQKLQKPTLAHLYSNTFLGPRHIAQNEVRPTLESLDAVVLISRYLKNMITANYAIRGNRWKPAVIYPGIDTSVFTAGNRVHQNIFHFSNEQPLRVLFVGRVIRQKGVQVLVNAVKLLVDAGYPVQLTIIGKTHPWEQKYENEVKKSAQGYPITFAGFVAPQDLPNHYAEHDLFVCPSQYREAFGLVNLEAMSSGLPVIGSRVGGIEEILENGAGMLVDSPQSTESFRAAIAFFLQHPDELRNMSQAAIKRAEKFSWQRTAEQFAELYESVKGQPTPDPSANDIFY